MRRAISLILTAALLLTAIPAYAAKPRTSLCKSPETMTSKPGNLPKSMIPASYRKGAPLAFGEKWMAYAGVIDPSKLTLRQLGKNTETNTIWLYDTLSSIIIDGSTFICLEGGLYSDNNTLEIFKDEETIFEHEFEQPDGYDGGKYVSRGADIGTLLLLDDGTLLIMDTYGALYACNKDGSGLRQIISTIIADFVYYDGMIYFMNLDDPAEYKEVYCDTCGETDDLYYPTLYRVRLDGSGLEKLTDHGVCGLASQGNIILYQNIDEAFVFDIPELCGYDFLSGPLYRYDAKTGEHRALGIESNQYIPTPYGLAVWYNEFRIEPYDVERADLVLHDYDGKPLYKLDAGVVELFGYCTVAGANIEFYSYNLYPLRLWNQGLADSWDVDDDSEEVFTTVPLDGSKKIGGVNAVPLETGYDDDEDDYGQEPDYEDWFDDEDWYAGEPGYDAMDDWWFDDEEPPEDDDEVYVYPGMFEDGWRATEATLNQRMATRTGPGTMYAEDHGTLPESTEIVIYAQEDSGGTPWALVEFVKNGKLVRAYTGMKRIDADTGGIPKTTSKPKNAVVVAETKAYYGPGTAYMAVEGMVAEGMEVLVYGVDRGYALIEYPIEGGALMRSWVPESSISF